MTYNITIIQEITIMVYNTQKPIRVEYDGDWPSTCMGTLKIYEDDELIYDKKYCCYSTGSTYFDDEGNDHIEMGELLWNDADVSKFREEIRNAVHQKLSEYDVCCGGCL